MPQRPNGEERTLHLQVNPPTGATFLVGPGGGCAISPEGDAIASVAASGGISKLWFRRLDSLAITELSGTEGAQFPFWSPDSRSLAFFAAAS
jgi:hypothetical protein